MYQPGSSSRADSVRVAIMDQDRPTCSGIILLPQEMKERQRVATSQLCQPFCRNTPAITFNVGRAAAHCIQALMVPIRIRMLLFQEPSR